MSDRNKDVKFIRKNGKVIPIKAKNNYDKQIQEKLKGMSASNFYWKAEHHKKEARSQRNTAPFAAAISTSISLAGLGGGAMSLAEGGKSGIAGAALGLGIGAYGAKLTYDSYKMGKAMHAHANNAEKLQKGALREEVRRQGYTNNGSKESFNKAFEKTVKKINRSPYRHNFSEISKDDLMAVYRGAY